MENHPIPQDITGFQFKLIGDLTVKQFAYVAIGVVLGWIFFALPINPIIKIPLAIFFVLFGIGLAFLPISGRPMDMMLLNFIKAFFRPTQFVYKEQKKEDHLFQSVPIDVNTPAPTPQQASVAPPLPKILPTPPPPPIQTPDLSKVNDLENKLNKALEEKVELEKKMLELEQKLTPQPVQPLPPKTTPPPPPQPVAEPAKPVSKQPGKISNIPPSPEFPNLIVGAIHDPRGNALPNILVEIKDKDGNPVRAFKTNQLGQFASATPLISGSYKIEIEDPKDQNKFAAIEFVANNEIIPPIDVTSVDTREELRRSLFGQA